jgi:hypothetical protein
MEKHQAKAQEYLDTKVIDVCLQLRKLAADEAAKAQGFAEAAKDSLKKHKQSQSKADSHNKSNIQKLKESVAQSQKAKENKKLAAEANAKGDAANAKADQAGQDADNHYVAAKGHDDKSLDANNKGAAADKRAAAHDRKADAADANAGKSRAAQQKALDASNVGGQAQTATAGGKGDCFTQDTNCKQLGAFCVHSASVNHCAPDCVEISKGTVCAEYKGCKWDADVEMCDNDEAVHESEIRKHKQGDANGNWLF